MMNEAANRGGLSFLARRSASRARSRQYWAIGVEFIDENGGRARGEGSPPLKNACIMRPRRMD